MFSLLRALRLSGVGGQPSALGSVLRRFGLGQAKENPGTMAARSKPTM